MCVRVRAHSLTRFFSLCRIFSFSRERTLKNTSLSMSDDEFAELKKKKKKSKKVDFDAFEEDGASAGKDGVAAATEKIEDLDRTFFVWGRKSPLLSLFLFQCARVFVVNSDRGSAGRSRCERRGVFAPFVSRSFSRV